MTKVTDLLTEEFIVFSKKIEIIFEEKKAKKAELKAFYEKINADLTSLDDEATEAKKEFDRSLGESTFEESAKE